MIFLLLSIPLFLLCSYLAWHCYRIGHRRHALGISAIALFMLLLSLVLLSAGYLSGVALQPGI